jgi:CRP-like cAMP-binding protein
MSDLQQKEETAERLAATGNKAEAVKILYGLIINYVEAKNFQKAEALRERLMEIDSLALMEIVSSAEAIDAAKAEAIDTDHTAIWRQLYDRLSQEEANAFYYSLKEISFDAEQALIDQGKLNSRLYLIDSGELKVIFNKGSEELLIKQLHRGQIAGADSFFPISHATVSVIAQSKSKLHFMERTDLTKLSETQPGLEAKLREFCKPGDINDAVRNKGLERRQQKRHNANGSVMTQLQNNAGQPLGKPFRGHLEDVSSGGLSFMIKSSRQETARLLLGRKGHFSISLSSDPDQPVLEAEGLIVAVHWYMQNDYAVHIRFDAPLRETDVKRIIPA